MRIPVTYVGPGSPPRDVVAEFDANATVAQLAEELAALDRARWTGQLWVDGRPVTATERLVDVGLTAGARLSTAPPPPAAAGEHGALELVITGGLAAGAAYALPPGETTIGRAPACEVVLADEMVSRAHAKISVDGGGSMLVEDLGSANVTTVNGVEVSEPTTLRPLDFVGIGGAVLSVVDGQHRRADLEPTGDGRFRYNKPPRVRAPSRDTTVKVPDEPPPPTGVHLPLGTVLAPLVLGPLFFLFTRQVPGLMLMMLASPLIAGLNALLDQRSGRRKYRKLRAEYDEARSTFQARADAAVRADEQARRAAYPDPASVRTIATVPTGRLWERRPDDPDHLVLRVGLCDQPAGVTLAGSARAPVTTPTATLVPVTVALATAGVLGVAGPRSQTLAATRALLLQVAALHSPNDVSIVVLSDGDEADWQWAKWLPHTTPRNLEACTGLFGFTASQRAARLAELARRMGDGGSRPALRDRSSLPGTVVVIDGVRRLRGDEAVAHLLRDGPAAGIEAICLAEEAPALPAETGASIVFGHSARDDVVVRVSQGGEAVDDVLPEGVDVAHAETVARALAPLFEVAGTASGPGALPPPPIDHLAVLGLPAPDAKAIRGAWLRAAQGSAPGVVGIDTTGPFTIDLVRDGPHALIAGTTGAGKSELLQTLVASLAVASRPDALAFLLVDFKGRSAFKDCERLPHTVGILSNLDGRLVERALDAIQAEMRWREARFADAGARDFDEFERLNQGDRIPRLVVVVDELKELADAYADSVPRLNQTARLGRGLGVHLVLATQKPASVPGLADLRANTDLRICLRVQDEGDSRDLVGVPDAARIPRGTPGRGLARLSDGRVVAFQAGYLGDPPGEPRDARIRTAAYSFDVGTLGDPPRPKGLETMPADGLAPQPTKLQVLVEAMQDAAGGLAMAPPRRPWLPPLPEVLTIDDPRMEVTAGDGAFAIGLLDLPAEQRQEPLVLDFDVLGHVLVAGRTRSGRTTVLRTLGGAVASRSSPVDVHLYGIEFRRRALQDLEQLPHCGGVAGAEDLDRMERLLDFLQAEIDRRGRVMGPYGSLAEQRRRAVPEERLPYVLVLCDNYESFYEKFSYEDGGKLVERFDWLLREGPARGIHFVVTTDQRAALHRLSSVIDAQLVLRPTEQDTHLSLGPAARAAFGDMPPGRGFWAAGPHEVQVALLSPSPSGEAQAAALGELAAKASARAQGVPGDRLAPRVAAMPVSITAAAAEGLRRVPRPGGHVVTTFAVGGLDVTPLDVDLRAAGSTFVVAGPRGSGRSTALLSLVGSLRGSDGTPIVVVAPRRSPLRDLAGAAGVTLITEPEALVAHLAGAGPGPAVIVVDDAELLLDNPVSSQLDRLVRTAADDDRIVVIGGTTVDLLRRFSGWTFEARQSRSGLVLAPASATDGELLDLRLPRSTGAQGHYPPGRGVLAVRGRWVVAQVVLPAVPG
jgi:DNA segregation ATPase FtsK/SpoIIIE, S-DNA-T family